MPNQTTESSPQASPSYSLPPVQTAAEYDADSDKFSGWLLQIAIAGETAGFAAYLYGWRKEWMIILAGIAGCVLGLIIPGLDRLFDPHTGLKPKYRKAVVWGAFIVFQMFLVALDLYLHPGD
jgi:hypothetical protein